MNKTIIRLAVISLLYTPSLWANQQLLSTKTDQAPVIDGKKNDAAWSQATTVTTHDSIADIDIEIQSVYTNEHIFLLVQFPDDSENREHKTLTWNKDLDAYRSGFQREDTLLLKWNMEPYPVDLTISGEKPYKADIWYWKAFRTDPMGYADDKMHIYSSQESTEAKNLFSKNGQPFYLDRAGDAGESAYQTQVQEEYMGEEIPRYGHRKPKGSRADVQAKGVWQDGTWTIEFRRKLNTGHIDDVQFDPTIHYQFGVSRHEIAGKKKNPKLEQPNYESGEIGEPLTLEFE